MFLALSLALAHMTAHAGEVQIADPGHAYNPVWSTDGQWLAFELNKFQGKIDLFVVKVAGGNASGAMQKVNLPGGASQFGVQTSVAEAPSWHPKGMLIFEGSSAGGALRLFFLPTTALAAPASELITAAQSKGDLSWPAVSPDGKTVAFVSDATGAGDIQLWDRGTNTVKPALTAGSPFSEMAPRFNPDNATLAYTRKNQGGEDLFTAAGGTSTPRVGGERDQSRPIWTNGTTMVFFTNERGDDRWDIATSNAVGNKTIIARDVRLPLRAPPAISPDGQWVAYGVNNPQKADAIAITKVDGSKTVELETGLVAAGEPALTSSGGRIYLAFTALPRNDADWRSLHIMDVTDKLQ
jgi:Tol biopolymer transport system component